MINKWSNPIFLKIYRKWKAVKYRAKKNREAGIKLTPKMRLALNASILKLSQDEFTQEMKSQHKLLTPIPPIYSPKPQSKPSLKIRGDDYKTWQYLRNMFIEDREGKPPSRFIDSLWKQKEDEK